MTYQPHSSSVGRTFLSKSLRPSSVESRTMTRIIASVRHLAKNRVGVEKVTELVLASRQQQGYKQTRVGDTAGNRQSRRLAAYDGATRPLGVAVLLLPHRRAGS